MFDKLLKNRSALAKYESGPHAEERKRFLEHLDECGYSNSRLIVLNRLLLWVANAVDSDSNYSIDDLQALATNQFRERPDSRASEKSVRVLELDFLFCAKQWMLFQGRFVEIETPVLFHQELEAFLDHLSTERGFAEATIRNRQWSLTAFFQWLENQGVSSLNDVGLGQITQYQEVGKERGWKRTTISFHTQALRAFFRYTNSKRWTSITVSGISTPRLYAYEGLPEGPAWGQVNELLENEKGDSPVQIRNRAMFLLFARYGFRLSEVRLLELNDLDWEKERIVLRRQKLRKAHEYPLSHEVGDAILRYLQQVRPRSKHRRVFLSLRMPYRPLSVGAIGTQVQKRMRQLSDKFSHFGPHTLRHACAKHLLDDGFTLKQIGDHLGHVSPQATQLYAKVDLVGLREVANLDMSELVDYANQAERNQTPVFSRGDIEALREVANLSFGAFL